MLDLDRFLTRLQKLDRQQQLDAFVAATKARSFTPAERIGCHGDIMANLVNGTITPREGKILTKLIDQQKGG